MAHRHLTARPCDSGDDGSCSEYDDGYYSDDDDGSVWTERTEDTNYSWFSKEDHDLSGKLRVFMVMEHEASPEIMHVPDLLGVVDEDKSAPVSVPYMYKQKLVPTFPAFEYLSDSDDEDEDNDGDVDHVSMVSGVAKYEADSRRAAEVTPASEYLSDSDSDDDDDEDEKCGILNLSDGFLWELRVSVNEDEECCILNLSDSLFSELEDLQERGSCAETETDRDSSATTSSCDDGEVDSYSDLQRQWRFDPKERVEVKSFKEGRCAISNARRTGGLWVLYSAPVEELDSWASSEEYQFALALEKKKKLESYYAREGRCPREFVVSRRAKATLDACIEDRIFWEDYNKKSEERYFTYYYKE